MDLFTLQSIAEIPYILPTEMTNIKCRSHPRRLAFSHFKFQSHYSDRRPRRLISTSLGAPIVSSAAIRWTSKIWPARRGRDVTWRSAAIVRGGVRRKAADSVLVMERPTDRTCKVRYGNWLRRRHVMHTDRRVGRADGGTDIVTGRPAASECKVGFSESAAAAGRLGRRGRR